MLELFAWVIIYSVIVALSIILIGRPGVLDDGIAFQKLLSLLLDWRFLLGGVLAVSARFIFVIINHLISKTPSLEKAHLTLTALATIVSIIFVIFANFFFLHEQLKPLQIAGTLIIFAGLLLVFR